MRVLVTGSSGFIGRHCCSHLLSQGYDVCRILRRPSSERDLIGDVVNWPEGLAKLDFNDCSGVVHLATDTNTKGRTLEEFLEVNLVPVKILVGALQQKAPTVPLIFISSQSSHADAVNWYGRSKWQIEKFLENCGHPFVILRPALVCGNNAAGLAGQIKRLVGLSPVIPVIDGGKALIQLLDVQTLCLAIERVLSEPEKHLKSSYVLAEETISLRNWIKRLANLQKKSPILLYVPSGMVRLILRFITRVIPRFPIQESNLDGLLQVQVFDAEPSMKKLGLKV